MSAAPYAAREVHETATKNGGELTSAEIGAGAVVAGGLHPLPHAPAGRLGLDADAKIVETYEYDAVGGGLVRVLNADASIAAGLLGAEIEGEVSASLSMPVPTVMPPAPGSEPAMVDYTLTVRTEAAGSKNLLGAFGLADLTAIAGASTTTGVVITAKLRSEQVIGLGGDPRPFRHPSFASRCRPSRRVCRFPAHVQHGRMQRCTAGRRVVFSCNLRVFWL